MVVSYLIPPSRGGADIAKNKVAACLFCNAQKGTKTMSEYREWLLAQGATPRYFGGMFLKRDWLPVGTPTPDPSP